MLWAALILIAAAAVLRFALADYSPWYDEFASLHFAGQPTAMLWSRQAIIETNPPLFYSLLGLWETLGAQSVVALRSLPILAGIVSLGLTVYIARRWLSARAAMIAALLMGLSAQHIYYSHLLRAYILSLDGVLLSIVGLLMVVHQQRRRDSAIGWGLHVAGSSLAIYCHTTMFLWPVIAAVALMALLGREVFADRGRLIVGLTLANLAIVAITAWWLWITYLQLQSGAQNIAWMKPISMREYGRLIMRACMFTFDRNDRDKLATNLITLITIASSITLWRDRTGRFIVLLALAAVLLLGAAGAIRPILMPRTVFWMSIFPVLLVSGGLAALRAPTMRWALVTVCCGLQLANLVRQAPNFEDQDWQEAVSTLAGDRKALLLVEAPGMINAFGAACLLELGKPCPFLIVDLPLNPDPDVRGQPLNRIQVQEVGLRISTGRNVYAIRYLGYDPFRALRVSRANLKSEGERYFLQGPLPASVVLAGEQDL